MSKNFKNYPDPREMLEKYGGDALRLYLLGSPVMHGEDILISEDQYKMQVRSTMLILWNVYNFFITYANLDGWSQASLRSHEVGKQSGDRDDGINVLDEWVLALLEVLKHDVTKSLDSYDTVAAIESLRNFVTDFSTWYIRRSRDRVGPSAEDAQDKEAFYETTYEVLTTLTKVMAPIAPFITEEIYRNISGEESVHLANWPIGNEKLEVKSERLLEEMKQVRKIVELGLASRKEQQLKVKQPLASITISTNDKTTLAENLQELLMAELNIKAVKFVSTKGEMSVSLDATLTDELRAEGQAREIIRKIQEERKKIETKLDEQVSVSLESWPEAFEDYIKKQALIQSLTKGPFEVKRL